MMDSARARTVGSSSTTRTVVGLAFSDFIRPTPLALKTVTMGQKRSSNPRSYFAISISPVAIMQQKLRRESSDRLQIGRSRPSWRSHNMHRAACFRHQADRVRRSARAHTQHETKALLLAQDYDAIAEDLENGRYRSCIPRCCRSVIVNARVG